MATSKKETQFSLSIALREDRVSKIDRSVQQSLQIGEKVAGIATGLLNELADGGLMLTADQASRIQSILGETTGEAIIKAADKAAGRRGGGVVVEWVADPSWVGSFEDTAKQQGITLSALVQQMMDTAVDNGWFYQMSIQPRRILLSEAADRYLRQVMGRDVFTGEDIVQLVKEKIAEADGDLFGLATTKEAVPA